MTPNRSTPNRTPLLRHLTPEAKAHGQIRAGGVKPTRNRAPCAQPGSPRLAFTDARLFSDAVLNATARTHSTTAHPGALEGKWVKGSPLCDILTRN